VKKLKKKKKNIEPLISHNMLSFSPPQYGYLTLREGWLLLQSNIIIMSVVVLDITLAGLQANFIMRPGTRSDPNR